MSDSRYRCQVMTWSDLLAAVVGLALYVAWMFLRRFVR